MRNLSEWLADHNKNHPESLCPPEIASSSFPKDVLTKWLPVFVLEMRNPRGEKYPSKILLNVSEGNGHFSASGGVQCKDCVVNVCQNSLMPQPPYLPYLPMYWSYPPYSDRTKGNTD